MNIKLLLCQKLSEKLPNELIELIFIYSKSLCFMCKAKLSIRFNGTTYCSACLNCVIGEKVICNGVCRVCGSKEYELHVQRYHPFFKGYHDGLDFYDYDMVYNGKGLKNK